MGWQPLATSTPFKINPTATHTNNEVPQKKLLKPADLVNIVLIKNCNNISTNLQPQEKFHTCKKTYRRKVSKFFDVSSSEDESNESYNLPGIKILSENFSRAKPMSKSSRLIGNVKSIDEIYINPYLTNLTDRDSSSSNKFRSKNKVSEAVKNKLFNVSAQNQFIDNSNALENQEGVSIEKENSLQNNNLSKSKLIKKSKTKGLKTKTCEILKNGKLDIKGQPLKINKSPEVLVLKEINDKFLNFENDIKKPNSTFPSNKYKIRNPKIIVSPARKMKKKSARQTKNDSSLQVQPCVPAKSNKRNRSHQLFSDSKGQELINSLDLTSGECKEDITKLKLPDDSSFLMLKTATKSKMKSKFAKSPVKFKKKSTKQGEASKEFPLMENSLVEQDDEKLKKNTKIKSDKKISTEATEFQLPSTFKNKTETEVFTAVQEQIIVKDFVDTAEQGKQSAVKTNNKVNRNQKIKKFQLKKIESEMRRAILEDHNIYKVDKIECSDGEAKQTQKIKNEDEKIFASSAHKKSRRNMGAAADNTKSSLPTPCKTNSTKRNSIEKQSNDPQGVISGITKKSEKRRVNEVLSSSFTADVFKKFNEISFNEEKQKGCFTAECWSLKNLKCGLFKINRKSQITSKTLNKDSYFGSVVITGSIKMKIGSKKLDLKEGDMAFVPPLTIWSAVNPYENAAILYYWSSKLKT